MGHPLIMGRKTHESIGKPLPGRRNIVVSRQPDYAAEGCEVAPSLDAARALVSDAEEVFCVGGAEIYQLTLPEARRIYLTRILKAFEGDVVFPAWDESVWCQVESEAGRDGDLEYQFEIWERMA